MVLDGLVSHNAWCLADYRGGGGKENAPQKAGDAGTEHGPVNQQADGDDGLPRAALPPDQGNQHEDAEGDGGQDQRVGPGDEVPARVQAEQQQDEEADGQERAAKVDAGEQRLVGDLGRHVHEEPDQGARHDDDGDLKEKSQPPPPRGGVVDHAAEHAAEHGA